VVFIVYQFIGGFENNGEHEFEQMTVLLKNKFLYYLDK
jgi:hypothetical protein